MRRKPIYLCVILFSIIFQVKSQTQLSGLQIKRATGPIKVDAVMDEADWQLADKANQFMQYFPSDTSLAAHQTEVRLTYDDQNIYLFAIMESPGMSNYVTPSLRRDFRGGTNDSFVFVLDTYLDHTNAFQFGINPFGVRREGLISNGGNDRDSFTLNWDNKWRGEAKILDGKWVCEFAIPFKTIRFKEGLDKWNINFYRIDSQIAERSTWTPILRVYPLYNLAFVRKLLWDKPLKSVGPNISVIPYVAGQVGKDFEEGSPREQSMTFGGDAKIGLSTALNLDLTVNPDFSQVEVDQQVTNLDRFEIFFPERRQFFLENADLFANFGGRGVRPFFSRRIGLARDTSTGQNIQNKIYGGLRLSGKLSNKLRVGLLSVQAGKDAAIQLPSTNFTVFSLQQKVFSRSNVGVIFINKQAFQDSIDSNYKISPKNFNRVLGLDYNLASKDNRWNGKFFYHRTFNQDRLDSTFATGISMAYGTLRWETNLNAQAVGANFDPEVGYVRRKDYRRMSSTTWFNMFPKHKTIQSHGIGFDFDMIGNDQYGFLDWDVNLLYRMNFRNNARFNLRLRKQYTFLFDPFDPSGIDGVELPAETSYTNYLGIASFDSDARKKFYYRINTRSGGYYNGYIINFSGNINYRIQPYANISIDFTYNRIRLPKPYSNADLLLIGPRFDFTFTRKIFWTTFVQYNSQISNMNINTRFQWRFKPVSDLFIVYTDNYFAETSYNGSAFYIGKPKIRALVVKLTYWLNI